MQPPNFIPSAAAHDPRAASDLRDPVHGVDCFTPDPTAYHGPQAFASLSPALGMIGGGGRGMQTTMIPHAMFDGTSMGIDCNDVNVPAYAIDDFEDTNKRQQRSTTDFAFNRVPESIKQAAKREAALRCPPLKTIDGTRERIAFAIAYCNQYFNDPSRRANSDKEVQAMMIPPQPAHPQAAHEHQYPQQEEYYEPQPQPQPARPAMSPFAGRQARVNAGGMGPSIGVAPQLRPAQPEVALPTRQLVFALPKPIGEFRASYHDIVFVPPTVVQDEDDDGGPVERLQMGLVILVFDERCKGTTCWFPQAMRGTVEVGEAGGSSVWRVSSFGFEFVQGHNRFCILLADNVEQTGAIR